MDRVVVESTQALNSSPKVSNTRNKTIKAKDPSEATELGKLSQDKLNEALAKNLHINNINSSLSNGCKAHPNSDYSHKVSNDSEAHAKTSSEHKNNVNSVQCSADIVKCGSNQVCSPDMHENSIETALSNLEEKLKVVGASQDDIDIISYESELQMPEIMRLIQKDLSEPYSIYTYRYFIHNWPKLCFLAVHEGICIGAIVCKLDMHRNVVKRGYIAMLAVDKEYRKKKIGSRLVRKAIQAMIDDNADEVVLETEITNKPALKLYENLGFVRDKRLFRYYLNGVDALRLKLWLR